MSRNNRLSTTVTGILVALALTGAGIAQETADSSQKCSKHQYTLASLAGNYALTGVFGSHTGGYVGTTDIDRKGVISNDTGVVIDAGLSAPLELSSTGQATVNPDGTGLVTLNVTIVGGPADVPYHFHFVITEARIEGDELIATRVVFLQQEQSPLPDGPNFASFIFTRRPE